MKEIQINNGFTVIVDDEDYPLISQYNWRAYKTRGHWYPLIKSAAFQRSIGRNPKDKFYLHWMILPPKQGYCVDHINRNPFDNRRCNLRYVSKTQNCMNRSRSRNGASGYKGVSRRNDCNRWAARIGFNDKDIYLGLYDTAEAAARAYDRKARELFGEYAALNFPEEV